MTADVAFERARPRLQAVAYGMLGEVGEAEDAVQDAWLRWSATDPAEVRDAEAFLVTVVTRLAIDRLRSARARREAYVGPWLPEPWALGEPVGGRAACTDGHDEPLAAVVAAEELSLALLAALERLNPVERAVLLLRDVFDLDYADVAEAVGRTPATCRQIAHRARERAGDPHVRFPVLAEEQERLAAAFAAAANSGSLDGLMELLAADAVLWSDGGGVVNAARTPVHGAQRIARFVVSLQTRFAPPGTRVRPVRVNGDPGARADTPFGTAAIVALEIADGRIVALRAISNPHKLTRLQERGS